MPSRPDPRVVGGVYFNGYWRKQYEVVAIEDGRYGTRWWTCVWDDGQTTTHCTSWDWRRDKILSHV